MTQFPFSLGGVKLIKRCLLGAYIKDIFLQKVKDFLLRFKMESCEQTIIESTSWKKTSNNFVESVKSARNHWTPNHSCQITPLWVVVINLRKLSIASWSRNINLKIIHRHITIINLSRYLKMRSAYSIGIVWCELILLSITTDSN